MSHLNDAQLAIEEIYIQISITQGEELHFFVVCFLMQDILGVHTWCFRVNLFRNNYRQIFAKFYLRVIRSGRYNGYKIK